MPVCDEGSVQEDRENMVQGASVGLVHPWSVQRYDHLLQAEDMRRRSRGYFRYIYREVFGQKPTPCYQLLMDALQLGRQLCGAYVEASFGIDSAEYITQNDRELAKVSKRRDTICRRT